MKKYSRRLVESLLDSIDPLEQTKTDAKMILAAKIADAMKSKGWKNKDLLAALKKGTPSVITKWLSGTHNFTIDTLVEIGQALEIDLIDLERDDPKLVVMFHQSVSQVGAALSFNQYPFELLYQPRERGPDYLIRTHANESFSCKNVAQA